MINAGGSPTTWDSMTIEERVDHVIDWRRQRTVLESLQNKRSAAWRSFDWDSDDWDTDTLPLVRTPIQCVATPVVLLEGVYSGRPELADLLDLRVLLVIPDNERRERLVGREGDGYREHWQRRWSSAEEYYFGSIVTRHEFDLVLNSMDVV